jgi:hypothetical protein
MIAFGAGRLTEGIAMHQRLGLAAVAAMMISATTSFAQDIPTLPDSAKTPGAVLEVVPDDRAAACLSNLIGGSVSDGDPITLEMICTPGYTKCIRNVSTTVKQQVYASYGLQGNHTGYCDSNQGCEVDHLISLELGGSNDPKNLWPEPYQRTALNAHVKDRLENKLHTDVCSGDVSLNDAQRAISSNWLDAYRQFIGEPPH